MEKTFEMAPKRIRRLLFLLPVIQTLQPFWAERMFFPDMLIFSTVQIFRFPDAGAAAGTGQTLRSQPDSSPHAPRDQIRRKEPLLRPCQTRQVR